MREKGNPFAPEKVSCLCLVSGLLALSKGLRMCSRLLEALSVEDALLGITVLGVEQISDFSAAV